MNINMVVYRGNNPRWVLAGLYPHNQVSGKFVRSLIVQGLQELRQFLQVQTIPVVLYDHSYNRELFWLENRLGKTYYEAVWNLDYECLRIQGPDMYRAIRDKSAKADQILYGAMFPDGPISAWDAENGYRFDPLFVQLLGQYLANKGLESVKTMTLRSILDEFVPLLKKDEYGTQLRRTLAQNTFVYFFRNHPDWTTLARQVLS